MVQSIVPRTSAVDHPAVVLADQDAQSYLAAKQAARIVPQQDGIEAYGDGWSSLSVEGILPTGEQVGIIDPVEDHDMDCFASVNDAQYDVATLIEDARQPHCHAICVDLIEDWFQTAELWRRLWHGMFFSDYYDR